MVLFTPLWRASRWYIALEGAQKMPESPERRGKQRSQFCSIF
jgi:hypothetical protein